MPRQSPRPASQILGKLALQVYRRNQQVMSPSQIRLLRDGLEKASLDLNWSKDYGTLETQSDIMMLTIAGVEAESVATARDLNRVMNEKMAIRELIADLMGKLNKADTTYPFDLIYSYTEEVDGRYEVKKDTVSIISKDELLSAIDMFDGLLNRLSDIIEAMLLDLQLKQQEMAEMMEFLSNIMKMYNDAVKSIINNMR